MSSTTLRIVCSYLICSFFFEHTNSTSPNMTLHDVTDGSDHDEMPNWNYTREMHEEEDYYNDQLYNTVADLMSKYIAPTFAALGLCGNVVNLAVWSAEPDFNPTTFFVKALAASDSVTLAIVCLYPILHPVFVFVAIFACFVSAHTTMAVVFTRWVAVFKPTKFKTLLTRCRLVVSFVLLIIWSLFTWVPMFLLILSPRFAQQPSVMFCITGILGLVLPVMMTLLLNVSLVCKLCVHRARSDQGQQHSAARETRSSRFNRMLIAVACMSVTTMLAYPTSVVVVGLSLSNRFSFHQYCGYSCQGMLRMISLLLTVFNASINVVYYLVFSSLFRELFRRRFHTSWRRRSQALDIPLSDNVVHTVPTDTP